MALSDYTYEDKLLIPVKITIQPQLGEISESEALARISVIKAKMAEWRKQRGKGY